MQVIKFKDFMDGSYKIVDEKVSGREYLIELIVTLALAAAFIDAATFIIPQIQVGVEL